MNTETRDLFADAVERLLQDVCTPAVVRAIEAGSDWLPLWSALADAGFADAIVPEALGGAGLGLVDALPMFVACGRHAVPVPLAQTAMVRAALAESGQTVVDGPVTLAEAAGRTADGDVIARRVPHARTADWVAVPLEGALHLLAVGDATLDPDGIHGSLAADLRWTDPEPARVIDGAFDTLTVGALTVSARAAGALERVFDLTLGHANQRVQFGKPIGKFQAIQHQIAVMAEHLAAARMAVELAAASGQWTALAMAKGRIAEAIPVVTAAAHAVHGAIGITAEFDLQLFTRRLHECRRAYGTESYWYERVGRARLTDDAALTVDFLRRVSTPVAAPENAP